jgi:hypothetical protein
VSNAVFSFTLDQYFHLLPIMYLSATNIVKSIFSSGYIDKNQKLTDAQSNDDHAYIRGDIADRGPCPGLNALANQGYLYVAPSPDQ